MRSIHAICALLVLMLVSCKKEEAPPSSTAPIAPATPAAPEDKPIQIPGMTLPSLDSNDWTKKAYQVSVLTPVDNSAGTKAEMYLAWTPASLLIRIISNDSTPYQSAKNPWDNDSVEIFLASSPGSDDRIQFICLPGRTVDHANSGWRVEEKRTDPPQLIEPDVYVLQDSTQYTMTISIPWANLRRIPHPDQVIGLQVYVNDAQEGAPISHRIWFPQYGAADHPNLMQAVQLTGRADAPEIAAAWIQPKGLDETVQVSAGVDSVGKKVEIWSSGKQVGSTELKAGGDDGSMAVIPLSHDLEMQKNAPVVVTVDGNPLAMTLKVPDLMGRRRGLLKNLPLVANPSIFDGSSFPKIDFPNHEFVEAAIGSYTIKTRFFDANWNEVTAPKEPGRYGVVVDFSSEDGITFTHYLTLYKTPQPYVPVKDPYGVTVKFPAAFGLSTDLETKEQWNISNFVGHTLQGLPGRDPEWAILVAGLHDIATNPSRWHGFTARSIDDAWWSEFRKRQGESQEYPHLTYLPDGYDKDPKKTWPLILFLHGSGQRGADLSKVKDQGPQGYVTAGHSLPFIVVTPQCPSDQLWDPSKLAALIDETAKENRVDPKRIYVTGLSIGGYGTYDLAATYPDKFAAIAPLSGWDTPDVADRLKKMPTWIFHGAEDLVVPTYYSTDIYQAMKKSNPQVKLTVYPGVGHGEWEKTYADPALYAWFLSHTK